MVACNFKRVTYENYIMYTFYIVAIMLVLVCILDDKLLLI